VSEQADIKCVIWDLDGTLWDGILLESDAVTLRPGIRDVIQTLDKRGILQSIASKNSEQEALRQLDAFGLAEYFICPEINWHAKSVAVGRIQKKLNIHPESFLFVDDSPVERAEVQSVFPEVLCVDARDSLSLPDQPYLHPKIVSEDSRQRRQMMLAAMQRQEDQSIFQGPKQSFLKSLNMQLTISKAREEDLLRAEELTVRSHQLNSTGITYDYDELKSFLDSPDHTLWICELTDRYGPYGKIGLALVEAASTYNTLRLLLISCRVMSLGIGTVLLSHVMQATGKEGKRLRACFRETDRNRMMKVAFAFANFKPLKTAGDGHTLLESDLSTLQSFPPHMTIRVTDT
jgi:FkbH-like protein